MVSFRMKRSDRNIFLRVTACLLALCIAALIALAALVGKLFRQYVPDPTPPSEPAEEP